MELITTHVGADFDAFATMLAAQRLHPGAELFFPGSREESLRRALEAGITTFRELRRKEIDPASIRRLILCDIRQRHRIGVVADWLAAHPAIEVWAYDHHPPSPDDLAVSGGLVDPEAGATATLMLEELEARGLAITGGEATVFLLGIYEDTGSLTYATTRPRDLRAAARLLDLGADLAAVRQFTQRSLDAPHLDVLHRMVQALEIVRIRGHRVGIVTLEIGSYLEELAPLVSRCLDLHALPLLVALFCEGERISLIARGDLPGLDLGTVAAEMGGGGHRTAAAASLRGLTLLEARERLLGVLARRLPPLGTAADLMTRRFCAIDAGSTVLAAKEALLRNRVNAAPVIAAGRVVGAITRQQLDVAVQHGFAERPVGVAMSSEVRWVVPEASLEEVAEALVQGGPAGRFVLVGDPETGPPAGLISRLAVLSRLHARLLDEGAEIDRRIGTERQRQRQIGRLLAERATAGVRRRLEVVRAVAAREGAAVFAVGGFVRDLLLERPNEDLDLVVEGDGLGFARALASALGGRVREHEAFLTAVVVDPEGFAIDVATARSEFYRAPAALPEVQSSVLRQDLYRRDFTINSLAIRLGPEGTPELLDFFGGQRDLTEGRLRVLHSLSFIDDPTRVLRAVRLEQRLGFRLAAESIRLVEVALREGVFDRLSGSRLRDELEQLAEPLARLPRGVERLAELKLLEVLVPGLSASRELGDHLRRVVAVGAWYRISGLAADGWTDSRLALPALVRPLTPAAAAAFATRLGLTGQRYERLRALHARLEAARELLGSPAGELPVHRLAEGLAQLTTEELLLLMAELDPVRAEPVRLYLERWRELHPRLRGRDLVAAGWPPGPALGEALAEVRRARLDGRIEEEEELAYAVAWLRDRAPDLPTLAGRDEG